MDGLQRWSVLRLHVEDDIPLTALARDTEIGLRTLQRWHQNYKDGGIDALEPRPRNDAGTRRTDSAAARDRAARSRLCHICAIKTPKTN